MLQKMKKTILLRSKLMPFLIHDEKQNLGSILSIKKTGRITSLGAPRY